MGGLPSMTAKTKPSHSPINKSGFRKGTVVPTWTLHLVLVKVHGNQLPYHTVTTALNKTFHISQISPLAVASTHQDAAVIAAGVSAAMAAQASKEFHRMNKPKITKLKGGYSADAELVFQSWHADIKAHIGDHDLDNSAALQLIKDQTQEGCMAWSWVSTQS